MKKCIAGGPVYLETKNNWENSPLNFLTLTIPFSCNFECLKCANSLYKESISANDKKVCQLLSYDEYIEIIKDFSRVGGKTVVIIGEGEPFHPKQLNLTKHIIKTSFDSGLHTMIFTNGSLLNDSLIQFLFGHNAIVIFSVDSLFKTQYATLTGTNEKIFDKVIENIGKTCSLYKNKKEHIIDKMGEVYASVFVGMNTMLSLHNINDINTIKSFMADDIIHTFGLPLFKGSMKNNYSEFIGNESNYQMFVETAEKLSETGGCISYCNLLNKCTIMNNGIGITPEGNYGVCNYSEEISEYGNWRDNKSLIDIAISIHHRVDSFFEENGHFFCLLRHPRANLFIDSYKSL